MADVIPDLGHRNIDSLRIFVAVGVGDGEATGRIAGNLCLIVLYRYLVYLVFNFLPLCVLKRQVLEGVGPVIGSGQLHCLRLYRRIIRCQGHFNKLRTLVLLSLVIPLLDDGDVNLVFVYLFLGVLIGNVVPAVGSLVILYRILSYAVGDGVALIILVSQVGKGVLPVGVLGCNCHDVIALGILGRFPVLIETNGDGLGPLAGCVIVIIPGLFALDGARRGVSRRNVELDIDDIRHQMSHIRDGIKAQILKVIQCQGLRLL